MPTGNFDEPLTAPPAPPPVPKRSFRLPSDYYRAPLSEVRPVFPKWAPYGCGSAAGVFLILLFAAGALVSGERFASLLDLMLGTTMGELRGMMAKDIPAVQKAQFENEVKTMREKLRNGEVSITRVQPFLKEMQKSVRDEKVTSEELKALTQVAHDAAKPVRKSP